MSDYVKYGTCGTCDYFEFESNNQKGYCEKYRDYFWDTDTCSNFTPANEFKKYEGDDSYIKR